MKVKIVSYCKTFNIGSYQSEKIGVEIDVEENETPEQCLSAAKSMVATFFTQSNPQLNYQEQETIIPTEDKYTQFRNTPISEHLENQKQTIESKKLMQKELITNEIKNSKTLKQLKEWKLLSDKYPDLKKIYDNKLKELTNG